MLRLRLEPPSREAREPSSSAVVLDVLATNESGSVQTLASPLALVARLLEADGATPHARLLLRGGVGGVGGGLAVGVDGRGRLEVAAKLPAGSRGGRLRARIELAAAAPAEVVDASAPRADPAARKRWVPTTAVPALAVVSPVFTFEFGDGAASSTVAATAAEDGGSDTATIVVVPQCSLGHAPVRIFEHVHAVTPGFGSVVWDCALLAERHLDLVAEILNAGSTKESGGGGGGGGGGRGAGGGSEIGRAHV